MDGPASQTESKLTLEQFSLWLREIFDCDTPDNPESSDYLLDSVYGTDLHEGIQFIFDPIDLRTELWGIQKDNPLVQRAMTYVTEDDPCLDFIVKDSTIDGKEGVFLVHCKLFTGRPTYSDTLVVNPLSHVMTAFTEVDKSRWMSLYAEQLSQM